MSQERKIGPETVVVRCREPVAIEVDRTVVMMSLAQGMYFGLEGAGPRIWALLEQPHSARQLCDQLVGEFEVDAETCLGDICEFLEELEQAQLVRVHDETSGPVRPPTGS